LCEGTPIESGKLVEILKRAQSNRKTLILGVIDRRNEIVYYSISRSLA
jgi:tRNA splicing endonuclease